MDADGDRDFDTAEKFVYDGTQTVLVFDDSDAVTDRMLWGPEVDQLFADENSTSGVLWALTDNLGSVRDLVSYNAGTNTTTVANRIDYDGFGNIVSQMASTVAPLLRFTARYLDPDTGKQWNLNRWYDSRTGRWLSQDPIGFAAGDVNLNRYVGNGATNAVDPGGLYGKRTGVPSKQRPDDKDGDGLTDLTFRDQPMPTGDLILIGPGNDSALCGAREVFDDSQPVTFVQDAIDKITAAYNAKGKKITVIIIDHGSSGNASMGDGQGTADGGNINLYASKGWTSKFAAACKGKVDTLWLGGCRVGAGSTGDDLLQALANGGQMAITASPGCMRYTPRLWGDDDIEMGIPLNPDGTSPPDGDFKPKVVLPKRGR